MAIVRKVVGQITLKVIKDVESTTYFYLLLPSTAPVPTKPTTNPPPVFTTTGYDGWSETEPNYTSGDTRSLYVTVRTVYSDGSFEYTTPSLSSSYEAAKQAYNRAQSAFTLASDTNQYFWFLSEAIDSDIPAGAYVTSIPSNTFKNNKTGGNIVIQSTGLTIRNGTNQLASLTGNALNFYNPVAESGTNALQLSIGANGALQSGNYSRGEDSKFASAGTRIDLTNGDIITQYFRVSQGLEPGINAGAYIHGVIEAISGKIGAGSTNYWEIGEYTDYNLTTNATMVGHGGSFIQLGDSSTWRLATNRLHTGWYSSGNTTLNYPTIDSKYWDFGIHAPTSKTDKFVYIRSSKDTTSSDGILQRLLYDIDDTYTTSQWDYQFYIDGSGNVHAPGFYIGDSTTPIGGGAGTVAERLTQGYGSATQPIYFNSNGVPTKTTYALNAAGAKGVDTSISAASTSTNLPTSQAVAAFVEGKGYITSYVDNKVQTSQANTTKIFLAGTSTAGTSTGTLNFDSNVYLTTTAGTLHATTFEGNLSGTASRATADGDGNTIKTTYLKLSGGNVTGAVTFGSSVSADELTVGDLVVNGSASFTNNLQANTINGVTVGSSPKFTDTVTTVTVTGNGNAITGASASNGAVTLTKGATFLTSYTETDPIFVASAAHGITSNDISNWNSKTSNTGTVTSVRVQATSPVTSSTSTAQSTTLNTTIALADAYGDTKNPYGTKTANYVLAGPSSGNAATPSFRKLVAADIPNLSWSKITSGKPDTASGYGIIDALVGVEAESVSGGSTTFTFTKSNGDTLPVEVVVYASAATQATDANYLTNGTTRYSVGGIKQPIYFEGGIPKASNGTEGTSTKPVYLSNGTITAGSTYAGGTKVTLNNSDKGASTASFYAPTAGGTTSQVLVGGGTTSAPTWKAISSLVPTSATNATNDSDGNPINTTYLKKTTYEYSKELSFGSSGKLLIGKFQCYDSNVTIHIQSTTSITYNATAILATQNINTTGGGSFTWEVYGDANNQVTPNLYAKYASGSDFIEIYFSPSSWSKNLIHIQCLGLHSAPTNLCESVTAIPETANRQPTNMMVTKTGIGASGTWGINISGNSTSTTKANLTTTANAVAYYTDTAGTFGSKASANGALYATSANGALTFGTLPAAQGGTGKTTLKDACNALINALDTGGSNLTSNDYVITQYVGGGTTTTTYHRRPASALRVGGLLTARKLKVALGSTTDKTFDGTADVTDIPISGTLSIGNGGTGATTAANARTNLGLGSAATASTTTSIASGGTGLPTAGTVYSYVANAISEASNTYVTIATDQTITANQKTFNGAIRWGTSSKYGAAHYDSTLEAIVFSFA